MIEVVAITSLSFRRRYELGPVPGAWDLASGVKRNIPIEKLASRIEHTETNSVRILGISHFRNDRRAMHPSWELAAGRAIGHVVNDAADGWDLLFSHWDVPF